MQVGKPDWWDSAEEFLLQDSILAPIVAKYANESLVGKGDVFSTLARSIVGQQISVIAADSIWGRLVSMVSEITPKNVVKFTPEQLASCGLTKSKSSYLHGIASDSENFLSPVWNDLTDSQVHNHLTSFRGIGPWTSEMIMIFALLRPDVFSIGDIGLIKGVKLLVPEAITKEDVLKVSERWAPYRTAASWYLWRMLDPVPVEY